MRAPARVGQPHRRLGWDVAIGTDYVVSLDALKGHSTPDWPDLRGKLIVALEVPQFHPTSAGQPRKQQRAIPCGFLCQGVYHERMAPSANIWNFSTDSHSMVHILCKPMATRRNRNGRKHHKSGDRRPYRAPDPEPYQDRDHVSSPGSGGANLDLRRREDASATAAGRGRLVHCGDGPAGTRSGWWLSPRKCPMGDGDTQTHPGESPGGPRQN